jgi:hypothetical protein
VRKPRQAFLIITVLLLLVILLVLCGAYLRSQVNYYRGARTNAWKAGARQLALSGLEDVRLKMLKDSTFPPTNLSTTRFTYVEKVFDESGQVVGSYRVTLRSDKSDKPFYMLFVQCEGRLGPTEAPIATHTLTALCDLSDKARDSSGLPNPRFRRWVQVRDTDWQY